MGRGRQRGGKKDNCNRITIKMIKIIIIKRIMKRLGSPHLAPLRLLPTPVLGCSILPTPLLCPDFRLSRGKVFSL